MSSGLAASSRSYMRKMSIMKDAPRPPNIVVGSSSFEKDSMSVPSASNSPQARSSVKVVMPAIKSATFKI